MTKRTELLRQAMRTNQHLQDVVHQITKDYPFAASVVSDATRIIARLCNEVER